MPPVCLPRLTHVLARGLLLALVLSSAPLVANPPTAALSWLLELPPDKAAHLRQLIEQGARDPADPQASAPLAVSVRDAQSDSARATAPPTPGADLTPARAALLQAAQARCPDLPPALTPWLAWAAHAASAPLLCPWRYDGSAPECAWPRQLTLDVTASGADFAAEWEVYAASWLPLPGAADAWPQAVQLNGEPVGVVEREGVPMVQIPAETRTDLRLTGQLAWTTRPASLQLPTPSGPLRLTVDGQPAPPDRLDATGRWWLSDPPPPAAAPVQLTVTRLLADGHPLLLTTEIALESAGAPRDLVFGPLLPEGFSALRVDSTLPTQLGANGALTVRVPPGRGRVRLLARAVSDLPSLTVPTLPPPWPATETWVFHADEQLRAVTLSGLSPLEPPPASVPVDWPAGPAFAAPGGAQLTLSVTRRGRPTPPPAHLTLARTAWLDFSGQGLTVADTLTGTLAAPQRLTVAPVLEATRVRLAGTSHALVPGVAPDRAPGLTLPGGPLTLEATSRLTPVPPTLGGHWPLTLPAAGWYPAPQASTTRLFLPPGWTLVAATGVDAAPDTWWQRWRARDLGLVLVTAGAVGWLLGGGYGLLALLMLLLTWHAPDTPGPGWLLVAALGLLSARLRRRAPRLARPVAVLGAVCALGLVGQALHGAAAPARLALDPSLAPTLHLPAPAPSAPPPRDWQVAPQELRWHQPAALATADLYLLAPPVTRLLAALAALLAPFLALVLLGRLVRGIRAARDPAAVGRHLALLALPLLLAPGAGRAQPAPAFPPPELLAELQATLRAPPPCAPTCASLDSARLTVAPAPDGGERLTLTATVQAAVATAIPLPGRQGGWRPDTVTVNGQAEAWRETPAQTWVRVPAGPATVELAGPLTAQPEVSLTFPLPPKRLLTAATGAWQPRAPADSGAAPAILTLTRPLAGPDAPPTAGHLPPWVHVTRHLHLGPTARVETRVTRLSTPTAAAVVTVPLLAGETVGGARDQAEVVFPPGATHVHWVSALPSTPVLELTAPASPALSEHWQLSVDPAWQVTPSDLPESTPPGSATRIWRPWPGDTLRLVVTPPPAAPPPAPAIRAAHLATTVTAAAWEQVLTLTLDTPQATRHTLRLPPTATALTVDPPAAAPADAAAPDALTLAVPPGEHTWRVTWRLPAAPTVRHALPTLDLGGPADNLHATVTLPPATGLLWATAGAAGVGPVVLLGPLLVLLVALALVARRLPGTPLSGPGWLLLGVGATQAPLPLGLTLVLLGLLAVRPPAGAPRPGPCRWRRLVVGLALVTLSVGILQGLEGLPRTYVNGPGALPPLLHWYQDRGPSLGGQTLILIPEAGYRGVMLLWALALLLVVGRRLRHGWACPARSTPAAAAPAIPLPPTPAPGGS